MRVRRIIDTRQAVKVSPLTPAELRRRRHHRRRADRRRRIVLVATVLAGLAILVLVASAGGHRRRSHGRAVVGPADAAARRTHPRSADRAAREAAAIRRLAQRVPYVAVAGRRRREVALTFDDGPGPYTLAVLRALRRAHAPATFFQVGSMIPSFPGAEHALVHTKDVVLGDHTETHPRLTRLSAAAGMSQIAVAAQQERRRGAPEPMLFRPPYGAFDRSTVAAARRLGMVIVLWTVDSRDYLRPGVPAIVARVLAGVRPGAVILLHDAGGERSQTVSALPRLIRALRRRHYRLVTVPRLLLDDPPPARQPPVAVGSG